MDPNDELVMLTRIVSHEFGNSRPLIPEQEAAANDVINNGTGASGASFDLVAQLPLSAFITINVSSQWNDVQMHLWRSIQIAFNDLTLNTPSNWGPSLQFVELASYV